MYIWFMIALFLKGERWTRIFVRRILGGEPTILGEAIFWL